MGPVPHQDGTGHHYHHQAIQYYAVHTNHYHVPVISTLQRLRDPAHYLGVTGTPVIDPVTDTAYFFVKTHIQNYRAPGNAGILNGVYYFYAVNVITLKDVPGFPILVDGTVAQNDPLRYFHGGLTIQRTVSFQVIYL
jgi:hypothetical protein